jgi:hypothetical protein
MACPRLVKMAVLAWVALCGPAPGAPGAHFHGVSPAYRHRFLLRPRLPYPGYLIPPPVYAPSEPAPLLPPLEPLPEPEPSPGLAYPPEAPSLPEGMAITIDKTLPDKTDADRRQAPPTIGVPRQAAQQLAACWAPPVPQRGDTVEVTLRFGFNRSGSVQWPPRVTYLKPGQGMSAGDVRESILAAFKACTPLHFTDSMAASMPGYPLSVRFIGRRGDEEKRSD